MGFVIRGELLKLYQEDKNVTSVTIPDYVKIIGNFAFSNCDSIVSVSIPDSVTDIGVGAFSNCTSLKTVLLGKRVKKIGWCAFFQCSSLENIVLNDELETIEDYAFAGCSSLEQITLPANVSEFKEAVFQDCNSLINIETAEENPYYTSIDGVLYDRGLTTLICCPPKKNTLTIPENVNGIRQTFFLECPNLDKVDVSPKNRAFHCIDGALYDWKEEVLVICPARKTEISFSAKVKRILSCALVSCQELQSFDVSEENFCYQSIDGVLYDKTFRNLIRCPCKKEKITIPETVTAIQDGAFAQCDRLTEIMLPEHINYIGDGAFRNCKRLKSIVIPDEVEKISDYAFCGCKSLEKVELPENLKEIGENAFAECESIKEFMIPETVEKIGEFAFLSCHSVRKFYYPKRFKISGDLGECDDFDKIIQKGIEMVNTKNFYLEFDRDIKNVMILSYYRQTADSDVIAYLKKEIDSMMDYIIETDKPKAITHLMETDGIFTEENIDKFIDSAIEHKTHEIYVLLTNYKAEKLGFVDIEKRLKL